MLHVNESQIEGSRLEFNSAPYSYIIIPQIMDDSVDQHEEWFILGGQDDSGKEFQRKILFHDYVEIYKIPGLYEFLFHTHLKCESPELVAKISQQALRDEAEIDLAPKRMLDLGAGIGLVGQAFKDVLQIDRIMAIDLFDEAKQAAHHRNDDLYEDYLAADVTQLSDADDQAIKNFKPDSLVCISALGFGDIPVAAFKKAYNYISQNGLVVFTVTKSILNESDPKGFRHFIENMIASGSLDVLKRKEFFHRLNIEGKEIFYEAFIGRKKNKL